MTVSLLHTRPNVILLTTVISCVSFVYGFELDYKTRLVNCTDGIENSTAYFLLREVEAGSYKRLEAAEQHPGLGDSCWCLGTTCRSFRIRDMYIPQHEEALRDLNGMPDYLGDDPVAEDDYAIESYSRLEPETVRPREFIVKNSINELDSPTTESSLLTNEITNEDNSKNACEFDINFLSKHINTLMKHNKILNDLGTRFDETRDHLYNDKLRINREDCANQEAHSEIEESPFDMKYINSLRLPTANISNPFQDLAQSNKNCMKDKESYKYLYIECNKNIRVGSQYNTFLNEKLRTLDTLLKICHESSAEEQIARRTFDQLRNRLINMLVRIYVEYKRVNRFFWKDRNNMEQEVRDSSKRVENIIGASKSWYQELGDTYAWRSKFAASFLNLTRNDQVLSSIAIEAARKNCETIGVTISPNMTEGLVNSDCRSLRMSEAPECAVVAFYPGFCSEIGGKLNLLGSL